MTTDVIFSLAKAAPEGARVLDVDERTKATVDQVHAVERWACWGIRTVACAVIVSELFKQLSNANSLPDRLGLWALHGVLEFLLIGVLGLWLVRRFVLTPIRTVRFRLCAQRIWTGMRKLPIGLAWATAWFADAPGGVAVDPDRRLLFVEGADTEYRRLLLDASQIVSASVAPRAKPPVRAGGRLDRVADLLERVTGPLPKGGGSGQAFLEIQYRLTRDDAVHTVTIPFGAALVEADSFVASIAMMTAPHGHR